MILCQLVVVLFSTTTCEILSRITFLFPEIWLLQNRRLQYHSKQCIYAPRPYENGQQGLFWRTHITIYHEILMILCQLVVLFSTTTWEILRRIAFLFPEIWLLQNRRLQYHQNNVCMPLWAWSTRSVLKDSYITIYSRDFDDTLSNCSTI